MCQICTLALQSSKLRKQDLPSLNPTSLSRLVMLNPSPKKKAELSGKLQLPKT